MKSKLVRDKIPEIIQKTGKTVTIHTAREEEYHEKLREKLQEEVHEFLESENPEELADILEVVFALRSHLRISRKVLERLRTAKVRKNGAFKKRIILEQ